MLGGDECMPHYIKYITHYPSHTFSKLETTQAGVTCKKLTLLDFNDSTQQIYLKIIWSLHLQATIPVATSDVKNITHFPKYWNFPKILLAFYKTKIKYMR